jgi:hypothetical protein
MQEWVSFPHVAGDDLSDALEALILLQLPLLVSDEGLGLIQEITHQLIAALFDHFALLLPSLLGNNQGFKQQ